jgi:probable rRNA maturation factor
MPVEIICKAAGKKFPSRNFKAIALKILDLLKQGHAELSLVLVGNREIRKLNAKYRGKNYPTDVLSFPIVNGVPSDVSLLGDVVISVEKARQQAQESGETLQEEMVRLLIHGILHLLGYDHERSERDARIMSRLEKRVHRKLCEQRIIKI